MQLSLGARASLRRRHLLACAAACAAGLISNAANAAPPVITAVTTSITSNADRLVSYRHQEHMWQTSDGALHAFINRGTLAPGAGLSLWSSFDGGLSWSLARSFSNTNDQGTGDGQLVGDQLGIAYPDASGRVIYADLAYDAATRSWNTLGEAPAFVAAGTTAINPACATDAVGNVWCAFVAQEAISRRKANNSIRMVYRPAGGSSWSDTGLVFGPVDSDSIERSARPVAINGGMGVVFAVRQTLYWAQRSNILPPNSAWTISPLYTSPTPTRAITDPYASHFSVVADTLDRVHVLLSDDFNAVYMRRNADESWIAPTLLDGSGNAQYCQLGIRNGQLTAAYSMKSGPGTVLTSSNGGDSFVQTAALKVPRNTDTLKYGTPRVEMPTRWNGPGVVFQQYEDTGIERLMLYQVP